MRAASEYRMGDRVLGFTDLDQIATQVARCRKTMVPALEMSGLYQDAWVALLQVLRGQTCAGVPRGYLFVAAVRILRRESLKRWRLRQLMVASDVEPSDERPSPFEVLATSQMWARVHAKLTALFEARPRLVMGAEVFWGEPPAEVAKRHHVTGKIVSQQKYWLKEAFRDDPELSAFAQDWTN